MSLAQNEKTSFLKNPGDAFAIIASVLSANIAMGAILITLHLSNSPSIAASNASIAESNARIDQSMASINGIYQILMKNEAK